MTDTNLSSDVSLTHLLAEIRAIVREELTKSTVDLMSLDEAAKLLSKSKSTVYRLTSQSRIPYMKKGNTIYFSKKELEAWVRSGKKVSIESTSII